MSTDLRIATRQSPLALWQAEHVKQRLESQNPELSVSLIPMTSKGDILLDSPLAKIGGKGLFIKELEVAMLEDRADIAVHSLKDIPAKMPEGFELGTVLPRENPLDALVSNEYESFESLPKNARVGTCSLRRKAQLLARRPDLQILDLRGNVNTRLSKLDNGDFDAIILAAAGLQRLGMQERIRQELSPDTCLPAIGQGTIGIEVRAGDQRILELLANLECPRTRSRVEAERALNAGLNGGCQAPVAGFATLDGDQLTLTGLVATTDGRRVLKSSATDTASKAGAIGKRIALQLLARGAHQILTDAEQSTSAH